ncbi:MAG: fluoride efflux transporter CrcB [Methanobacteriota archaeon]|nr:MAG: fluoride efflux transporter CrcB [Euryarchaeota archaeon]
MMDLLLIGMGGFIGAAARYLIAGWLQDGFTSFPAGTLGVNVAGSFLLGLFMYLGDLRGFFTEEQRLFFAIGVLGAFTTMSTFSYESLRLFEQGETLLFTANVLGTVGLTLLGVYLGRAAAIIIGGA